MTPVAIATGRKLDSVTALFAIPDSTPTLLAPGDANRVAMSAALLGNSAALVDANGCVIGPLQNGIVVPLTCMNTSHPACYLSVDKIGSALFPELYAWQVTGAPVYLGVTVVRQVQEL